MDWQTIYYIVSVVTMFVFLFFLVFIAATIYKVKSLVHRRVDNLMAVGSLAKLSALRLLLKIMR